MVAGPSEITIVADKKSEIKSVITSLIGQAEHDVNSQCIIISKDISLLKKIKNLIKISLKNIPWKKIAEKSISKIVNAGSICSGKFSAMAVTDYNVGTNHVLPTMGSARFSSGLNVCDFYKKISYINLSKKGIEVIGKQAITLAEYENLEGHAQSIKSRIRSN